MKFFCINIDKVNKCLFFLFLIIVLAKYDGACQIQSRKIKRAQIYIQNSNYKEAARILKEVIESESSNIDAHYLLGLAYKGQKKYGDAEKEFIRCIGKVPGFEQSYIQLASMYSEKKEYEKAFSILDKLLVKNPHSAIGHYALGVLYYLQKKINLSISQFEKSILNDKKLTVAYINLGIIYLNQKNYDEAINKFKKVVIIDSGDPECQFYLGWTYYQKGDKAQAFVYFKKASSLKAPHVYSAFEKAIISYENGDNIKALKFLDEVFYFNKNFAPANFIKGKILIKQKKYKETKELIDKMVLLDPLDSNIEKLKANLICETKN